MYPVLGGKPKSQVIDMSQTTILASVKKNMVSRRLNVQ